MKIGKYEIMQASNNHIAVFEDGKRIIHATHNKKEDEAGLLELLKFLVGKENVESEMAKTEVYDIL